MDFFKWLPIQTGKASAVVAVAPAQEPLPLCPYVSYPVFLHSFSAEIK